MTKKIHLIAAARPNFMKIAPLYHALKKEAWAEPIIVHTGQHYDLNMSDAFFTDLKLPAPHIHRHRNRLPYRIPWQWPVFYGLAGFISEAVRGDFDIAQGLPTFSLDT